jgi:hypothetical protein
MQQLLPVVGLSNCRLGAIPLQADFGKAAAGAPHGAMRSCAAPEIVHAAAKDDSDCHAHDYGLNSDAEWTSRGPRANGASRRSLSGRMPERYVWRSLPDIA